VALPTQILSGGDWTIGDFCAGTGMLAVAVQLALKTLGARGRVVVHCERNACAAASLVARMEATGMGFAPVWDELGTFDGRPWRGLVDIACAGLPCPAYSHAGRRAGNADERAWGADGASGPVPQFLRVVGEMRPALVFLENVPAWVADGWFRPVGDELSRLGYEIEDPLFLAAEDVGGPHRRERVFILAYLANAIAPFLRHASASGTSWAGNASTCTGRMLGHAEPDGGRGVEPRRRTGRRAAGGGRGEELGDTERPEPRAGEQGEQGAATKDGRHRPSDGGAELGDARCDQHSGWPGVGRDDAGQLPTAPGGSLPLFPPGPGLGLADVVDDIRKLFRRDPDAAWRRYQAELANTLAWRDILAVAPEVEPAFSGVADGLAAPADSLRLGGNGVVPLVAAHAFRALAARIETG